MMVVSYGIERPVGFINQRHQLYPATSLLIDAITTAAALWYSQITLFPFSIYLTHRSNLRISSGKQVSAYDSSSWGICVSLRWKQAWRVPTYPHIRPTSFWIPAYNKEFPSWPLLIPHSCQWRFRSWSKKIRKEKQRKIHNSSFYHIGPWDTCWGLDNSKQFGNIWIRTHTCLSCLLSVTWMALSTAAFVPRHRNVRQKKTDDCDWTRSPSQRKKKITSPSEPISTGSEKFHVAFIRWNFWYDPKPRNRFATQVWRTSRNNPWMMRCSFRCFWCDWYTVASYICPYSRRCLFIYR